MSQSEPALSVVGSPDEATTVLAPGTHVVGRLSGQEDIRVHGTIEGHVHLGATLFIAPEGVVAADVHARDIVVAGTVVGNLAASGSIVLAASARVVGDLRAPRLVVAPGAAFRGQVSMDPPEEDEFVDEAAAGRGRAEGRRWSQAIAQSSTGSRPEYARTAPARPAQSAGGLRLPPPRAATPVRRRAEESGVVVKHPAATRTRNFSTGSRPEFPAAVEDAGDTYSEAEGADWGDGVKRTKKVARPRILARGKHKVERL